MRFDILTIFPEMFSSVINCSIQKRAVDNGILSYHIHNIRDFSTAKHKNTDDYPFGGGNGMVMQPEPIFNCIEAVSKADEEKPYCIMMTPRGKMLTPTIARNLSKKKRILLLCGHYEGIDERVMQLMDDEISTGDYVLTGGELPAMVLCDCISRFIPGVLGTDESAEDESFSLFGGLLEYPQYTRPAVFRDISVPDVLLSGNHHDIEAWRKKQSIIKTAQNRPDLLAAADLTPEERAFAQRIAENIAKINITKIELKNNRTLCVYPETGNFAQLSSERVFFSGGGYFYTRGIRTKSAALAAILADVQLSCKIELCITESTEFVNTPPIVIP